jgi:aminoglycoside phosphotransferase (APT) family kinase protein
MTAILDWELCHIGDIHEDLGWALQPLFTSKDEHGAEISCYLMKRSELIDAYQRRTGRTVDLKTLQFYEVLSAYKVAVMGLATSVGIAIRGNSHQDSLLAYLAPIGHTLIHHICLLIERGPLA